jgi:MGT family glycosyltransferase
MRNHIGSILVNRAARPILTLVNKYRDSWGLERFSNIFEIFSRHPTISQLPQAFDFPYRHSPKKLFYTGPFLDREARRNTEFPFEKLNGRPLIYASLGTIQTNRPQIFQIISRACEGLGVQLVISLGGGSLMPQNLPRLAGDPLVVHYAPQLEILQKARITITHAGINTTLESLAAGVPLVAIPISDDQPGVGARIRWTGTGLVVEAGRLSVSALRYAIVEILQKPQYRKAALQMQEQIRNCGGLRLAAALVEEQLGRPDPWCQS